VLRKQAIALDDYLCDRRVRVLGWREGFILQGLRDPGTATDQPYNEKESDPEVVRGPSIRVHLVEQFRGKSVCRDWFTFPLLSQGLKCGNPSWPSYALRP
jgi:hypothetical protein